MRLAGWLLSPWALIAHGSMRRSAGCAENHPMQSETPYAIQRSRAEVIADFECLRGFRAGPYLIHRAMHQRGISLGPAPATIADSIPLFARLLYFRGCITARAH